MSLVNVPGLVLNPTVNPLVLLIPVTKKFLLYPLLAVAAVFSLLLTFVMLTSAPTVKL